MMPEEVWHIVVVDDDASDRSRLADILSQYRYRVSEAENAEEALVALDQDRSIKVVVTDIQMPGSMDGIQLCHQVRKRWPSITLVIASGMWTLNKEILPAGVPFLRKPIDTKRLLAAVAG